MRRLACCRMAACLLLAVLAACSKPTPFNMGEQIPLGDTRLTVTGIERTSVATKEYLGVHIRWSGLKPPAGKAPSPILSPEDKAVLRLFFADFNVVDEKGNEYPLQDLMPEMYLRYLRIYNVQSLESAWAMMQQMRYDMVRGYPEDWVIFFDVPRETKGLSLKLKNPFINLAGQAQGAEGQPERVIVGLGI